MALIGSLTKALIITCTLLSVMLRTGSGQFGGFVAPSSNQIVNAVNQAASNVQSSSNQVSSGAQNAANQAASSVQSGTNQAASSVQSGANQVSNTVSGAVNQIGQVVNQVSGALSPGSAQLSNAAIQMQNALAAVNQPVQAPPSSDQIIAQIAASANQISASSSQVLNQVAPSSAGSSNLNPIAQQFQPAALAMQQQQSAAVMGNNMIQPVSQPASVGGQQLAGQFQQQQQQQQQQQVQNIGAISNYQMPNPTWKSGFSNSSNRAPAFQTAPDTSFGNPVPLIDVDTLVAQCRDVNPKNRCPPNNNVANPINLFVSMQELGDVDNKDETMKFSAIIVFTWNVTTCSSMTTAPQINQPERLIVPSVTDVWRPLSFFESSANDVQMQDSSIADNMEVVYFPTYPTRQLLFYWTRRGTFTASCDLDLSRFPFDKQSCDLEFSLKESTRYVYFSEIDFYPPVMAANSDWILLGTSFNISATGTKTDALLGRSDVSRARFTIEIERKPYYYLYSLLTPCWTLQVLVLATFLLDNDCADRSVFAMSILLALFFVQSDFLGSMPSTPERILMAEYLFFLIIFTGSCTLYSMLIYWLTFNFADPEDDENDADEEKQKAASKEKRGSEGSTEPLKTTKKINSVGGNLHFVVRKRFKLFNGPVSVGFFRLVDLLGFLAALICCLILNIYMFCGYY